MVHFEGFDYRSHTSCISEAQKYQGHLYREKDNKKGKNDRRKSVGGQDKSQDMVYKGAYVEDARDDDGSHAVAIVDVPPRAPTPPTAYQQEPLQEAVNVFDYLVEDATPNTHGQYREIEDGRYDSQYSNGEDARYLNKGYSYGNSAVTPSNRKYDSFAQYDDSQQSQASMAPPSYVTPAPKDRNKEGRSDKKRKRGTVDELDLSTSKRPVSRDENMPDAPAGRTLHSGLTGGLSRLITSPEFYEDRIDAGPTPISPIKRSKREGDFEKINGRDDRRKSSYGTQASSMVSGTTASTRYHDDVGHRKRSSRHRDSVSSADEPGSVRRSSHRNSSVQPSNNNALTTYSTRAELFMSFITKGPDSERGLSVNKVLKRYHRERETRNGEEKEDDDKELFKGLRLRRNERGEIVLFAA
jgi:cell growth-regulating nucleolar protein